MEANETAPRVVRIVVKFPPMPRVEDFKDFDSNHVSSYYMDALRVWKEVALAITGEIQHGQR